VDLSHFCGYEGLKYSLVLYRKKRYIDHEVKFNLSFRAASECYVLGTASAVAGGAPSLTNASLFVDYIYLDTDERRQFAQVQHKIHLCIRVSLKKAC
jgi:hypothetical protein